ncbi:MAG: hypothetical protein U1D31_02060 [Patescibacteria group bacterium]|nr:hypothetical protein [bacterium]MDZ4240888.1 hypothetical protein [Patescibacteria group bacterium]
MKKNLTLSILLLVLLSSVHVSGQSVELEPIVIVPGLGTSWNPDVFFENGTVNTQWGFFPYVENYDNLIRAMEEKGYVLDQTLFIAFYDWRKNNSNSVTDYLIPTIDKALEHSLTGKVDIIAHSMGGLVARSYIQGDFYRNDVDQFFMLGTPNYGSSDAYTIWEGAQIPDHWPRIQKTLLNGYLGFLNVISQSVNDKYDVIHTFVPSIKELLPLYIYIQDKNTGIFTFPTEMYEQNNFLANLDIGEPPNGLEPLFLGVREITNIGSAGLNTLSLIPVVLRGPNETKLWADGIPDPQKPVQDSAMGDNTVLLESSLFEISDIEPYDPTPVWNEESPFKKLLAILTQPVFAQVILDCDGVACFRQRTIENVAHEELPTQAINLILERLDFEPTGIEFSPYHEPDKILSFWFASPVDVKITAPDEKIITKDVTEVPEAFYDGTSDPLGPKFILIPDAEDGNYKVELSGIGDGEYHMVVSYVDENSDNSVVKGGTISSGEKIGYSITLTSSSEDNPTQVSDPLPIEEDKTALELIDELISDVEQYYTDGLIKGFLVKKTLLISFNVLKAEIKELNGLLDKYETKPTKQIKRRIKILEGLIKAHIKGSVELLNFYSKKQVVNGDASLSMIEKLNLIRQGLD